MGTNRKYEDNALRTIMHHRAESADQMKLSEGFTDQLHAVIGATIIHQDTLQGILTGLLHHILQTSSNVRRHIIDRNDNGYLHD